ncbi:Uma2 family endonuclease [Sphingomonas sp.]|jgi:Uma2 family endonuclease|uniref:Uma2 family endonuclease n=1 Tax=Sphingomonas sp. TaxID=28214 RepID=UPI002D7F2794|nr:Uma2 family endonuclease [Sphingomonas sp.]HEU0045485.1 Uma2 family endonuclease [Sphingomonas sp.]
MDLALAFEDSQPFKLTVDQYHDLMEQGVVEEGSNVELLEGMIVSMNSQAVSHTFLSFELAVRLREALKEIGSPLVAVTTPTVSMPPNNALDPDVAVTDAPEMGPGFLPVSGVRLLIEVSRTTLRKDMKVKRDIYAQAGVPEYWVVDVNKAEVHRFAEPAEGVYRQEQPIPLAGPLASLTIPDLAIDGSAIL